ncbi:putative Topless family protein [Helianthus anomalus]
MNFVLKISLSWGYNRLEQESGLFFNMKYFEEEVHNGNWDEVEKYLSGFTKVDNNRYSMTIFFEIRKQKYLEALDKHDRSKVVETLVKDLKVFASFNEDLFKEITQLLTLENFRENEQLSKYGDTKSARAIMLVELKKLIEAKNPLFRDKLQFPNLKNSILRTLINQSFVKTRGQIPISRRYLLNIHVVNRMVRMLHHMRIVHFLERYRKLATFLLWVHMGSLFQPAPASVLTPLVGWMSNPPTVSLPTVSDSVIGLDSPSISGNLHDSLHHFLIDPLTLFDDPLTRFDHLIHAVLMFMLIWLGGTPAQTSLARTLMNKVKIQDLEKVFEPLFYIWRLKRKSKESFGD